MDETYDVVVVGAGVSGIGAACHLARSCPDESVLVLEARERVGGTWDLFRYPGVRSDSSMFTYAYDFAPWPGPTALAEGADILDYLEGTARAYGLDRRVRLGHRVVRAAWSSGDERWRVTVRHAGADGGETESQVVCRFLWVCTGYYRYDHGHLPALAGREDFTGRVVHPQAWPADLDMAGRDVVVVGSGATAVTLVPALVDRGARVTMLQRSPSYVASVPRTDPGRRARLRGVVTQTGLYALSRRAPRLVRAGLLRDAARRLPRGYDVATHFTPRYDPWDQRLCVAPDGDLFAAISTGRAEVVTDTVDRLVAGGVRTETGRVLPADVVVTATGLELLALGGLELVVDGEVVDPAGRLAWRGLMLEGVPNCALTLGYSAASWTLRADLVARFVTRLLGTMRRRGLATVTPLAPTRPQQRRPLLALRAGYVLRDAARLPSQGSRHPWVVRQDPVRERLSFALRRRTTGLRLERSHGAGSGAR
ncbi:FAD-containing monooxygenase EthA [Microlunatus spumicola]|uniref:L-lysine N6-monooxygenase MbtG n=1 Tax=Microlunatus spumicola TaxID=81499 RepID=A0ABP6XCJ7_9ACTN